jgi:hypothetical protein
MKVRLEMLVHPYASRRILATREVELPIAPFVGMQIYHATSLCRGNQQTLRAVTDVGYDLEKGVVIVAIEGNQYDKDEEEGIVGTFGWVKDELLKGWDLEEV